VAPDIVRCSTRYRGSNVIEIIAHRGSSFIAPENTLAAFALAWQEGSDAIEGDFRLTRDGHVVAMHDKDLQRVAGDRSRVADLTLDELRQFDVGRWKHGRFAGQRAPTLEEILAARPADGRVYVEIKCGLQIVTPLVRLLADRDDASTVILISFFLDVLSALKSALPQCKAHGVFEFKTDESTGETRPSANELIDAARKAGLDGVDLDVRGPIDKPMVDALLAARLDVCVWTVDDPKRARELTAAGVRGLTTNRPGWLRKELEQNAR
jgi:glycerophosphoryl diester phosphodiesterase